MEDAMLPNTLIVGAMKSGTTWLHHQIEAHPQAFMSRPKEIHFFDEKFDLGLGWYRRFFEDGAGKEVSGEATHSYMYDEQAARRMARVLPQAKLLAVLRDPVQRAYSHYWWNRGHGWDRLSFRDAIAAEPERLRSGYESRMNYSYVDRGRYARQLESLAELYGRDRILILFFEDIQRQPEHLYRSVCRFLRIDDEFMPVHLDQRENEFISFRNTRLRNATARFPSVLRRVIGRVNIKRKQYPSLDVRVRHELDELLAEDNARLRRWLGRDLPGWGEVMSIESQADG